MLCQNMELFDGGKIAVAAVTLEMMAALDAREEDAEDVSAFQGRWRGAGRRHHPGAAAGRVQALRSHLRRAQRLRGLRPLLGAAATPPRQAAPSTAA